jgi:hypothetical protein
MALEIYETIILTDEDARLFENAMKNVHPLSSEEIEKIKISYELLKKCDKK